MGVILDSTILIDVLNGDEAATAKIRELEAKNDGLFTTQINVFEIIQGVYCYGKGVDEELAAFHLLLEKIKILDLNYLSAYYSGKLAGELKKRGITIPQGDLLIAGIGISNNLNRVVTKNEKDFSKIPGIKVETY
ncbi:PIN domain-containing protein [Candidatus Micrarchaeota archaeon]|nr:PIN domain-containing protein [Candidatus Micrarchaeota archaeon]